MFLEEPKEFNKCPNCGSENKIVGNIVEEEIEAMRLKKGYEIPLLTIQAPIFDPNNQLLLLAKREVPVVICLLDACADCGTLYVTKVARGKGSLQPEQIQQQMRNK